MGSIVGLGVRRIGRGLWMWRLMERGGALRGAEREE